jgi:hypothetical protein
MTNYIRNKKIIENLQFHHNGGIDETPKAIAKDLRHVSRDLLTFIKFALFGFNRLKSFSLQFICSWKSAFHI